MGLDYKQDTFIINRKGCDRSVELTGSGQKGVSVKRGCLGKDRIVAPGNYRVGARGAKTENVTAMISSLRTAASHRSESR